MLSNLCKRCEHCKSSLDEVIDLRENLSNWMECVGQMLSHFNIRSDAEAFLQDKYPRLFEELQKFENRHHKGQASAKPKPQSRRQTASNKNSAKIIDEEKSQEKSPPKEHLQKFSKNGKDYIRDYSFQTDINIQALGVLSDQSPPPAGSMVGVIRDSRPRPERSVPKETIPVVPPPSSVRHDLTVSNIYIQGVVSTNAITSMCMIRDNLYGIAVDNVAGFTTLFDISPTHPPDTFGCSKSLVLSRYPQRAIRWSIRDSHD